MNVLDIVKHLRVVLPTVSDDFASRFEISSVVVVSGVCTVTTAIPHRLRVGELVSVDKVATKTPILTVAKTGLLAAITTSAAHDLTESLGQEIELEDFTDEDWNGKQTLGSVPNRRNFTIATTAAAPVLTGDEVLLERNRIDGVNGLHTITAIGATTISYATTAADGIYEATGAGVSGAPRVHACATPDRAREIYDEYRDNIGSKAVAFVISEGGSTSKDRLSESDAIAARVSGDDLRLKVVDEFTVAVYLPTEKQIAAERALGRFTGSIMKAVVTSIFGLKLPSVFACGDDYKAIFSGHELIDYDRATMVWGYSFQVPQDLTIDDAVLAFGSRAFRDLDTTVVAGKKEMTVLDIDLDEEPLT